MTGNPSDRICPNCKLHVERDTLKRVAGDKVNSEVELNEATFLCPRCNEAELVSIISVAPVPGDLPSGYETFETRGVGQDTYRSLAEQMMP